jgi:hypothetical protein
MFCWLLAPSMQRFAAAVMSPAADGGDLVGELVTRGRGEGGGEGLELGDRVGGSASSAISQSPARSAVT